MSTFTTHRIFGRNVRLGQAGRSALWAIGQEPGICTAEVDRRARTARGGHKWMYATVERLMLNSLVEYCPAVALGRGLRLTPAGEQVLAQLRAQ